VLPQRGDGDVWSPSVQSRTIVPDPLARLPTPAAQVSGGKALCLITTEGDIAAFRISAIDIRNRATFEHVVW
jgi:hypothetical protein